MSCWPRRRVSRAAEEGVYDKYNTPTLHSRSRNSDENERRENESNEIEDDEVEETPAREPRKREEVEVETSRARVVARRFSQLSARERTDAR